MQPPLETAKECQSGSLEGGSRSISDLELRGGGEKRLRLLGWHCHHDGIVLAGRVA